MLPFAKNIQSLLNEYKIIIKKHLTHEEWTYKIKDLGLKRKVLKSDDEITLYRKANKVAEDIFTRLKNEANTPSWYSGLDEYCQHLKNVLNEYQIDNHKIIHTSQCASRAIVEAIQLIKLPNANLNAEIAKKLENCGHIIARYGTREQQEIFAKTLENFQQSDVNFFMPLLHSFEKHLHEFATLFTEVPA